METEVYADLLFLVNAGMDGLCLLLTGRLLHRRVKAARVALAAILGGVYAVVALFPDTGTGISLLLDVTVCLSMCGIVFGGRGGGGIKGLLSSVGVYFLLSMALGGIMTGLYHLLNRAGAADILPFLTEGGDGPTSWLFLILAIIGGGLSLLGGRLARRAGRVSFCTVTVELDGKQVALRGMVDSGNLLRDPIGGRVVICAERSALFPILSPALRQVAEGVSPHRAPLSPSESKRVRVIPTATATGSGLLYGFVPDRVSLANESDNHRREVDAVIAMTHIHTDGVKALVPSELI
ncbi:MAG: sigma-E processing peptidase SpoIIGA [Clostridia bacterium]|nr:sigma-E processing peptidase SpoIIGA [Clostridia bacterium]